MKKETVKKTGKKVVNKPAVKAKETTVKTISKPEVKKVEKVTVKKENKNVCKYVELGLALVAVVLLIVGICVESAEMPCKLIGLLMLGVLGQVVVIQRKDHVLLKSVGVWAITALLFTWFFPYGYFQGATFTEYGMQRVGLNDLPTVVYYAIYFSMDKIIFLLAMAGFYGLLSKTSGYQKVVSDMAKKAENNKMLFAMLTVVVIVLLTALFSQTLAVLFFIPFVISILSKLKFDKLTSFVITFGTLLAAMIGSPWGTEGQYWFNYYAGTTLTDGFTYRLIAEAFVLVLFLFFAWKRVKKMENKENAILVEDVFEVSEPKAKTGKTAMIIILAITALFMLLGYIKWETNFGVTVFSDFHTWLTGLTIGESTTIFSYILGKAAVAFGEWDIITGATLIFVMSIIVGLVYRVKLSDYIDDVLDGMRKMAKPIALFMVVFVVFVTAYTSPFIPTLTNWMYGLSDKFNPYLATIMAFITSVFHADFGYTGYVVGGFLKANFADNIAIAHTIYFAMYGLVQLLVPTSGILLLGLGYTKVEYKSWLKYIWKFAVGILVILLVLFTIVTYA
jgi:uncharacterized ion transporter superfamily protein YfcC